MSYHARMAMPPLIVTGRTGAFGKHEAPGALAAGHDFGHDGLEIMRIGAEAMQPDDGGVGLGAVSISMVSSIMRIAYKNRQKSH
jgi:hypothetical protein